ncbi:hypothetical protein C8R44DRAFT_892787 [Mycena epipterygia]|nr:hypothetical protein C8R44DRAFT_892787 [Mycena epipterygia]
MTMKDVSLEVLMESPDITAHLLYPVSIAPEGEAKLKRLYRYRTLPFARYFRIIHCSRVTVAFQKRSTDKNIMRARYFWNVPLNRLQQLIRYLYPADITSLPLANLAFRAYKLRKNWASASSRAVSDRGLVTVHLLHNVRNAQI